jgi:hypothetical protein
MRRLGALLALVLIVAACGRSYPPPPKIPPGATWDWNARRWTCIQAAPGKVMPACADSIPDD